MPASVKPPLRLKKRQLSTRQRTLPNFSIGAWGEILVCDFLTAHGYSILDRNCRYKLHELDIVALDVDRREVVFVEVKTRSSGFFGDASLAVDRRKLRSLVKVAEIYMRRNGLGDSDFRFDIVTVVGGSGGGSGSQRADDPESSLQPQINHYTNVTWEMVK